ncbi:hypothetical protein AB5N19_11817 [Seiridium cardinale]|uniref:Heterokaryon incompatibility domain-containing protein n=1 Tax=Seiridium cardinale TaxID=138064 RepID=A0ABR2XHA9_9PEZI
MFRCINDNIEDLKIRLPVSSLPGTFRDAFEVLKYLEIRYMWIDSLCIIQDLDEDWAREAQAMMSVYQQAFLDLAATTSSSSELGMFRTRAPCSMISSPFKINNSSRNDIAPSWSGLQSTDPLTCLSPTRTSVLMWTYSWRY